MPRRYSPEWYQEYKKTNGDRLRANTKRYRLAHIDRERKRCRDYNRANKEQRAEYLRKWRARNADKSRAYDRSYYQDNLEKSRAKNIRSRSRLKHTPKYIFTKYRSSARRRGLEFALTIEQFISHWQKPCYYCGSEIATIGLDRINNSVGYTPDNVRPCHYACNVAKATMSSGDFIKMCVLVASRHGQVVA